MQSVCEGERRASSVEERGTQEIKITYVADADAASGESEGRREGEERAIVETRRHECKEQRRGWETREEGEEREANSTSLGDMEEGRYLCVESECEWRQKKRRSERRRRHA